MDSGKKLRLVVSTGAGISAESGISTFRDADGLWENYPVMEVCSADGFQRNPALVHQFYNERRHQLLNAKPNRAHQILAELENDYDVRVITQNVDDLHERAGSSNILHLHGELMKMRSIVNPQYTEPLDKDHLDTNPSTRGKNGDLMRPHIVFFQEAVPNIEPAIELAQTADIFLVVGTSLVVYPAASLIRYVRPGVPIYYVDLHPADVYGIPNLTVIAEPATKGLETFRQMLASK
jgi:NAD-dependent deacetylase